MESEYSRDEFRNKCAAPRFSARGASASRGDLFPLQGAFEPPRAMGRGRGAFVFLCVMLLTANTHFTAVNAIDNGSDDTDNKTML